MNLIGGSFRTISRDNPKTLSKIAIKLLTGL